MPSNKLLILMTLGMSIVTSFAIYSNRHEIASRGSVFEVMAKPNHLERAGSTMSNGVSRDLASHDSDALSDHQAMLKLKGINAKKLGVLKADAKSNDEWQKVKGNLIVEIEARNNSGDTLEDFSKGDIIDLIAKVKSRNNSLNATLKWKLGSGFEHLSGPVQDTIYNLNANEEKTVSVTVKVTDLDFAKAMLNFSEDRGGVMYSHTGHFEYNWLEGPRRRKKPLAAVIKKIPVKDIKVMQ